MPAAGGGEGLGNALLLVPFGACFLIWFWVGEMNLLQRPDQTLLGLGVITILLTAALIAAEASQLEMGTTLNGKGKKDSGPVAWFIATLLFWVVMYPWYLFCRSRYGKKNLIVGGLLVAAIFLGSWIIVASAIDTKRAQILRSFDALRQ